jgi:acyl-CoA synthetase (AMP-forming)/AMP-acid ligase II
MEVAAHRMRHDQQIDAQKGPAMVVQLHEHVAGIGSWPKRRALLAGERIALIDGNRRITYAEFDRRTDQFAQAPRELGVRQGDRVAALMFNSAAFLEAMFAAAKLGAIFVPVNFRLAPPEVAYLLADSGADVFVWSGHLSELARAALAGEGVRVRECVVVGGEPGDGEADVEQLLGGSEPQSLGIDVAGGDLACLMIFICGDASSVRRISTFPPARWASSLFAARTSSSATGDCPRRRPRRFAAAGSTPATWDAWTPRGSSLWSTARKDMIISGGENVYPIEVEQVLYRHSGVREVAVVGVPHTKWGETPIAVVALKDGAQVTGEDLIGYARERLAHYKCPTRVEYVAELPRNATGKVLKTTLRKEYGGRETSVQR